MCGIIGVTSKSNDVLPFILQGLRHMEYRGYDSWGIGLNDNGLQLFKRPGKISGITFHDLRGKLKNESLTGVGHTRWATTGEVSETNAHPHVSAQKKYLVVHNGIVENYAELKDELLAAGYMFRSQTDTEVIAHMVEYYAEQTDTLLEAVMATFKKLAGRNGFLVMEKDSKRIIGARKGSPLIVGYHDDHVFIASDVCAFMEHTKAVTYMNDNEFVVIDDDVKFFDIDNNEITKTITELDWEPGQADLGDFDHYMLKEIMEQQTSLLKILNQDFSALAGIVACIKQANRVVITGSGTAGKVAYFAEYMFSFLANKSASSMIASEFKAYADLYEPGDVMIVVSQSGETADCLEAIERAQAKGLKIIAVVNVKDSSIDRLSDYSLYLNVGPEIAVASTKATTAQMLVVAMIASALGNTEDQFKKDIVTIQNDVDVLLEPVWIEKIKTVAMHIMHNELIQIIGTGAQYPVALEGSIKIVEVSYLVTLGLAARELKHYAISLVEPGTPVIVLGGLSPHDQEVMLTAAQEVKTRGALVIGIDTKPNQLYDFFIPIPDSGLYKSIPTLIVLQFLAYFLAILRGYDPDKPKNLAKSVTVV